MSAAPAARRTADPIITATPVFWALLPELIVFNSASVYAPPRAAAALSADVVWLRPCDSSYAPNTSAATPTAPTVYPTGFFQPPSLNSTLGPGLGAPCSSEASVIGRPPLSV